MQGLPAPQILAIWDSIQQQRLLVNKALAILAQTQTDIPLEVLSKLSLGQRNNRLIKVREQLFGSQMTCQTHCLHCNELVEFVLQTQDFYQTTEVEIEPVCHPIIIAGYIFHFRLLNSEDLLVGMQEANHDNIYDVLIRRSLLKVVNKENVVVDQLQLSPEILREYSEHLQECDPQAEILLNVSCRICNKEWQSVFDIAGYLIQEISAHAKRILYEVHLLATAYGWTESAILAMNPFRRQFYLEAVTE